MCRVLIYKHHFITAFADYICSKKLSYNPNFRLFELMGYHRLIYRFLFLNKSAVINISEYRFLGRLIRNRRLRFGSGFGKALLSECRFLFNRFQRSYRRIEINRLFINLIYTLVVKRFRYSCLIFARRLIHFTFGTLKRLLNMSKHYFLRIFLVSLSGDLLLFQTYFTSVIGIEYPVSYRKHNGVKHRFFFGKAHFRL